MTAAARRCSSTPGQMGSKISRTQIELDDAEIERIAATYHAWRGTDAGELRRRSRVLSSAATSRRSRRPASHCRPAGYVGAPESEEDEIAFEERMAMLIDQLAEEMTKNERLADEVKAALAKVGYDV